MALIWKISDLEKYFPIVILFKLKRLISPERILKSRKTKFEWQKFDGSRLNYTGNFASSDGYEHTYTSFSKKEIKSKIFFKTRFLSNR